MPVVALRGAALGYGGAEILSEVDLEIHSGDLIAIAGPNGSGKTTLFRTILGFLPLLGGSLVRNCALGEIGYDPTFGARPLKRAVQKHLENPLAEEILAGRFGAGDTIRVDRALAGGLSIRKVPPRERGDLRADAARP